MTAPAPDRAPDVIATRGLRKVYPAPRVRRARGAPQPKPATPPAGIVALDGLDLAVRPGEFFGLLGPNGAGKTTTLGILTTRVRATGGEAWVAGAEVSRDPVSVKRRIGVVPQRPNPDRSLTTIENLVFHASYFGVPRRAAEERARRLLGEFELSDKATARIDALSGGQQQRLMIARALMHDPEILFLDEPTVGLDPHARLGLWATLRRIHAMGHALILTTHYMEEADQLCQRIAIIDRGRLLALDTPAALKQRAPGGTLVEATLEGDATPLLERIRALPGVERADAHNGTLRAWGPHGGELAAALLRTVEGAGHTVCDVHLAPPSLETLFLTMTGRKLE
ncbi:MAG TPA: ABC transporter ATP-binding protein [Candidatus Eisenbacteria bacterium]|nr:ABC transporter ATP-binding protein [Candidatus Eisenbacteria bacterium]